MMDDGDSLSSSVVHKLNILANSHTTRAATKDYFLLSIYLLIIFLINQLVVWSIKCWSQFPKAQDSIQIFSLLS